MEREDMLVGLLYDVDEEGPHEPSVIALEPGYKSIQNALGGRTFDILGMPSKTAIDGTAIEIFVDDEGRIDGALPNRLLEAYDASLPPKEIYGRFLVLAADVDSGETRSLPLQAVPEVVESLSMKVLIPDLLWERTPDYELDAIKMQMLHGYAAQQTRGIPTPAKWEEILMRNVRSMEHGNDLDRDGIVEAREGNEPLAGSDETRLKRAMEEAQRAQELASEGERAPERQIGEQR